MVSFSDFMNSTSKTVYAPNYVPNIDLKKVSIFLAGSIEMGSAENWQPVVTKAVESISELGYVFNPRRLDFQKDAEQKITNPYFAAQVNWELDHIEQSDIVFMYLDPFSKSPISLMELGHIVASGKVVICCPDGFWRKGNVDVICSRYNIPVFNDLPSATKELKRRIVEIGLIKK